VNVPVEWDGPTMKNIAWKVELPGSGWSSPVISKGRIYLTSAVTGADSGEVTLHALCADSKDGHTIWDAELFKPAPEKAAAMHQKNTLASPTPLLVGDRLYVHFGHMGTAALAAYFGWRAEIPVLQDQYPNDERRHGKGDRRRHNTAVERERRRGAYDRRTPLGA
jgi:hypothetical protein